MCIRDSKEAITAAFPKTEQQRCIVHMVRNTLKYVSDKDRKAFATDLKTIYHAANEEKALEALEKVTEKWLSLIHISPLDLEYFTSKYIRNGVDIPEWIILKI